MTNLNQAQNFFDNDALSEAIATHLLDVVVDWLKEYHLVQQLDQNDVMRSPLGLALCGVSVQDYGILVGMESDGQFTITVFDPEDNEYETHFADLTGENYTDFNPHLLDMTVDFLVEEKGLNLELEAEPE